MANVKKGQSVPPREWWRHLRTLKRAFWKHQRRFDKLATRKETAFDVFGSDLTDEVFAGVFDQPRELFDSGDKKRRI
jgi:hypothetical protein